MDGGDATLDVRVARVDQVEHEVRVRHLLERGAERLHELVGQAADEADRVREQHRLAARQPQPAGRGIERGEQPVLHEHGRVGEPVEQRGLPGVGVAHERDVREGPTAARLALGVARPAEPGEIAFELREPPLDPPPVDLELGLTGAAGPDPATLLDSVTPRPRSRGRR